MAFVDTPKLALPGSAVKGDGAGTWVAQWNQICANLEARLTKSGVGSPVGAVAGEYIGQLYYQTDVPIKWWCTLAGAIGVATWTSAAHFQNGVTFGAGNVTLASLLKFIVPTGESWLQQNGVNMSPHAHGGPRHRLTGADAAWTSALDGLKWLIQDIQHNFNNTGDNPLGTSFLTKAQLTRNFTGRTGATSKVLAFGAVHFANAVANQDEVCTGKITRDSSVAGDWANTQSGEVHQPYHNIEDLFIFEYFTALTAASHTFQIEVMANNANYVNYLSSRLILLDFGDAE